MAQTSQLVGRCSTGVVRIAKPDSTGMRGGTKVHELLGPDGAHAPMTMHAQYARQAPPNPCWTQQPSDGVWSVSNRPAQSTDQDAIGALAAFVVHGRTVGRAP